MTDQTTTSSLEAIRRISPYAIDETSDTLRPMREQRELQQQTFEWTGDAALARKPFVILIDGAELEVSPLAAKPVVIRHRDLKHIFKRHAADGQPPLSYEELLSRIEGIADELRAHGLAYDDPGRPAHVCHVLNATSRGGNPLIAVADASSQMATVNVVDIVTIHGRNDLRAQIARAEAQGLNVYINERTSAWEESSAEPPRETPQAPAAPV